MRQVNTMPDRQHRWGDHVLMMWIWVMTLVTFSAMVDTG
jgi:hypothetical protein